MNKTSTSYSLLDEKVRKWIWRQGWTSLKDIQENAIPLVLAGDRDVIISASTAGGKTEAAFFTNSHLHIARSGTKRLSGFVCQPIESSDQ